MRELDDTTCLIPFYKTERLLPHVFENIDSHIELGGQVICSDEHLMDGAAKLVAKRYRGNPLVTVLETDEGGNWVSNCNRLIVACKTPFFRICPHDDTILGPSTLLLAQTLRLHPQAVLSHGRVLAETEDGERLPQRDEPFFPLNPFDDTMSFSAAFFWMGLYSGAFKAVMRRDVLDSRPLLIRPTDTLRHSERAWLFAYSLLGGFVFTPEATMVKRYWSGSLTDSWKLEASDMLEVADVMASYTDDLVDSEDEREKMRFNLYLNASTFAAWCDDLHAYRPQFQLPFNRNSSQAIVSREKSRSGKQQSFGSHLLTKLRAAIGR